MCYYYMSKGKDMRLLRLAIETQNWNLAAHTIVLATARILKNGDRPRAKNKEKTWRPQRQPKR